MTLDWSTPIRDLGDRPGAWCPQVIPHWRALYDLLLPALVEKLSQQHWENVKERFDAHDPTDVDDANHSWRELVTGAWRLIEAWEGRLKVAARARARRVAP